MYFFVISFLSVGNEMKMRIYCVFFFEKSLVLVSTMNIGENGETLLVQDIVNKEILSQMEHYLKMLDKFEETRRDAIVASLGNDEQVKEELKRQKHILEGHLKLLREFLGNYGINLLVTERKAIFLKSEILTFAHLNNLRKFGVKGDWEKIASSKLSATPQKFHELCDNQGPLFIIVKYKEYIFGAYMSVSLTSSNSYKRDSSAYLFILQTPNHDSATIFPLKDINDKCAIYDHQNYFPTFGRGTVATGYDFYIHSNLDFTANLETTYQDVLGRGAFTFTGVRKASSVYFEVFAQV